MKELDTVHFFLLTVFRQSMRIIRAVAINGFKRDMLFN